MKYKVVDDEGNEQEIEAYSPEELEEQVSKVKTEYEAKIQEKDTTLESLAKEKEELETKLGGTKEDHPNFKVLKEALSKKDEDIKALRNDIDNDRKIRKDSLANEIISKASRGSKDLEDKIKYHLENTVVGMKDETPDQVKDKVLAAIKLASDVPQSPNAFDVANSFGNPSVGIDIKSNAANGVEFTEREKALGKKLGITEEDYKKYGPRLKNK